MTLSRGKVNAFNEDMVEQIHSNLEKLENDEKVKAVILTGRGKFFSFGFDIPEFLSYSKDSFIGYLTKFANLYTYLFIYPKPTVVALNGHAIAGGAMLSLACDHRIMVGGKAKISLNEITFGASVFAGCVEMLKLATGFNNAQKILYSGAMFTAEEARQLGFIDQVSSDTQLLDDAGKIALGLAGKDQTAFKSIKGLLRNPISEKMMERERASVLEFADIWYTESTWSNLQGIKIHT
ncbi:MAG: enoyl-CoA hydratase/isomerase family protein [candidate division Zixibacteria bacterium]|nr:enoyl-CoA hydratase/isomerase family protein [candidate division Zixibacteria bacterium]